MKPIRLECTRDNHFKFWTVVRLERLTGAHDVLTRWGRIGSNGQAKVFHFTSRTDASKYVSQKVREKLDKGYVEVAEPEETHA